MTDPERQVLMLAYAADSLEPAQREKVRALLASGDLKLVGALAEAEAMLARLGATATPVEPSAALKQRMLRGLPPRAAIGQTPDSKSADRPPMRLVQPAAQIRSLAVAAAIGAIVVGSAAFFVTRDRYESRLAIKTSEHATDVQQNEQLQGRLDNLQDMLGSSNVHLATMTQPGDPPTHAPRANVLWDIQGHKWYVVVFDLAPPPPGQEYQLWFLPEGGKPPVPAPTFTVDAKGRAEFEVALPPGITKANAAVTAEPKGGSKTPTMPIKLVGNL